MTTTLMALTPVHEGAYDRRAPAGRVRDQFGIPAAMLNTIGLSKAETHVRRRVPDDLPDRSTAYRGLMVSSG